MWPARLAAGRLLVAAALTRVERALVLEAHHTIHIEGTRLTLEQSERLLAGEALPEADPDDVRELLNYRSAFEFVSTWLGRGGPITEGLVREHGLSDRQALALGRVLDRRRLTIQNYETLCSGSNRRTLQRDLKALVDKGLLVSPTGMVETPRL